MAGIEQNRDNQLAEMKYMMVRNIDAQRWWSRGFLWCATNCRDPLGINMGRDCVYAHHRVAMQFKCDDSSLRAQWCTAKIGRQGVGRHHAGHVLQTE